MNATMESVWDYPRPPAVEPCPRRARVLLAGTVIADSRRALRVLETSQPPGIYLPPDDVDVALLESARRRTLCEWKGIARYHHAVVDGHRVKHAAWTYPRPVDEYVRLAGHFAFYPGRVQCWLDDELVAAGPGDFYGGWVTAEIAGPFKGGPGTMHW
jgi:uncharacterized protein (DUF427 family)